MSALHTGERIAARRIMAHRSGAVVVALAVVAMATLGTRAFALPPDPMRPLEAETCDVAQARLAEARLGSPLVSAETNAEIVVEAEARVERLCAPPSTNPDPIPTPDEAQVPPLSQRAQIARSAAHRWRADRQHEGAFAP